MHASLHSAVVAGLSVAKRTGLASPAFGIVAHFELWQKSRQLGRIASFKKLHVKKRYD